MRYILFFIIVVIVFSSCFKSNVSENKVNRNSQYSIIDAQIDENLKYDPFNLSANTNNFLNVFDLSSERNDRKVLYRDIKCLSSDNMFKNGIIVTQLCINNKGEVVFSKYLEDLSSIKDRKLIKQFVKCSTSYKFEAAETAPEYQCCNLTFNLKVN